MIIRLSVFLCCGRIDFLQIKLKNQLAAFRIGLRKTQFLEKLNGSVVLFLYPGLHQR